MRTMKEKILIINILVEEDKRLSFDRRMDEVFSDIPIPRGMIYLEDLKSFSDFHGFSHLLISGSEATAYEDEEWFPHLERIIRGFHEVDKPILGICFAHQFLARMFMGKDRVRQSATPEIGWTKIELRNNPLFKGLVDFKSAVYHNDEVAALDQRFDIIAQTDRCRIHAFQLKGSPLWGIQFHPDFGYHDVYDFVKEARETGKHAESTFLDCPVSIEEFRRNDGIFTNWLKAAVQFRRRKGGGS